MMNARSRAHRILSSLETYTSSPQEEFPDVPNRIDRFGAIVGLYRNFSKSDDIWILEYGAFSKKWEFSYLYYGDISSVDLHGEKAALSFSIFLKTKTQIRVEARTVSDRLELSRFFSRVSEDFGQA